MSMCHVDVSEWLWQAIQGDFNENRSTGQIAFDAALSMIPLADQICDVRDLVANSRKMPKTPKTNGRGLRWRSP